RRPRRRIKSVRIQSDRAVILQASVGDKPSGNQFFILSEDLTIIRLHAIAFSSWSSKAWDKAKALPGWQGRCESGPVGEDIIQSRVLIFFAAWSSGDNQSFQGTDFGPRRI